MISEIIEWKRAPRDSRGLPVWAGSRPGISILLTVQDRFSPGSWAILVKPAGQSGLHQSLPNNGALEGLNLKAAARFCGSHTNEELFALGEETRRKRG